MGMQKQGMICKCPHHSVVPLMITLIGVAFLLQAMNILTEDFVRIAWPLLLTIAGLTKLSSSRGICKCC